MFPKKKFLFSFLHSRKSLFSLPRSRKKKVVYSLSLALIIYKKTNDSTYNNNEKEEEDDKLLKAEKLAIDGLLGIYMVTARAMKDKKL